MFSTEELQAGTPLSGHPLLSTKPKPKNFKLPRSWWESHLQGFCNASKRGRRGHEVILRVKRREKQIKQLHSTTFRKETKVRDPQGGSARCKQRCEAREDPGDPPASHRRQLSASRSPPGTLLSDPAPSPRRPQTQSGVPSGPEKSGFSDTPSTSTPRALR